ncbi:ATP-binding protein [Streptomyces coeruleorubidus]|uniref:ATP-binding protein n=1 Tax=Streptomyces coeruleorubidus TaxID=116188 RepID=UPI003793B889
MAMAQPPEEDNEPVDDGGMRTAEQARDVTRGFLLVAAPEGDSAGGAVLLVVSELFTNALLHAGGVTGFRLEAGPGTVTVAVHDASPLPPQPLPMDASRPGGFGWHLVQELSVDVRVQVHPAGKTVTAIVPCPTGVMRQG